VSAFAAAQSEIPRSRNARNYSPRTSSRPREPSGARLEKSAVAYRERERERERERKRDLAAAMAASGSPRRRESRKTYPRSLSGKDAYSPRWSLCIFTRLPTFRVAHLLRPGRPSAKPSGISSRPRREMSRKGSHRRAVLFEHGQVRFVRKRDNAYSIFQRRNCGNAPTV